jgi:phosphoglycolate phosphatase-like HAD superfamily hydrolase
MVHSDKDKYLYLFDYDGTLVIPPEIAYKSIIDAFARLIPDHVNQLNWGELFEKTKGTSDKALIETVAHQIGLDDKGTQELINEFGSVRSETYLTAFFRARPEYYSRHFTTRDMRYDWPYNDALFLLQKIRTVMQGKETLLLVTGNSRQVMDERLLDTELRTHFCDKQGNLVGVFGDEVSSRKEMIELAIQKTTRETEFSLQEDEGGFALNVFYLGDTENDLLAGWDARVRTVFIPRNDSSHDERMLNLFKKHRGVNLGDIRPWILDPVKFRGGTPERATITSTLGHPIVSSFLKLGYNPATPEKLNKVIEEQLRTRGGPERS